MDVVQDMNAVQDMDALEDKDMDVCLHMMIHDVCYGTVSMAEMTELVHSWKAVPLQGFLSQESSVASEADSAGEVSCGYC